MHESHHHSKHEKKWRSESHKTGALVILNDIWAAISHTFVDEINKEHLRSIGYDTHTVFSDAGMFRTLHQAEELQKAFRKIRRAVLTARLHEEDEKHVYEYLDDVMGDLEEFKTEGSHYAEHSKSALSDFNRLIAHVRADITGDTKELIEDLCESEALEEYFERCAPHIMEMTK